MPKNLNKLKFEVLVQNFEPSNHYSEDCMEGGLPIWFKKGLDIEMYIDDVLIKGSVNTLLIDPEFKYQQYKYGSDYDSNFYPLVCSCPGKNGCAGMCGKAYYVGVLLKKRRYTVEWRVKDPSYRDALKSFYSFDKNQYEEAILELKKTLKKILLSLPEGEDIHLDCDLTIFSLFQSSELLVAELEDV